VTWGLVEVHEFADVERVRQIRNTCREFMTRDTREISESEQLRWWCDRKPDVRLFLFRLEDKDVGYGLTREEGRAMIISGGLLPDYRKLGIGYALFRLLTLTGLSRGRCTCRLEVRKDNGAARTIYERIGFDYVDSEENGVSKSNFDTMELNFL